MTTVLVVDDEPSYAEALTVSLEREGFEVVALYDGPAAVAYLETNAVDLVLLDVMLPGMSGVDVCRRIRASSQVPVIMVTARADEIDAVVGLEVGADDYVAKPYRLRELVARMRAVLRRAASGGPDDGLSGGEDRSVLVQAGVRVDVDRHVVHVDDAPVDLPLREFELLVYLMERAGRVVTRDALMHNVWGYDYVGDTKTIDVHIRRLRSRVERDPANPVRIRTVRGLGYRFETEA